MQELMIHSPSWYRALTLTERLELLKIKPIPREARFDVDLAEGRISNWRKASPFDQSKYFYKRLASEKINRREFLYLLGESDEAVKNRVTGPLKWLSDIVQAFARDQKFDYLGEWILKGGAGNQSQSNEAFGLLRLVAPLLNQGINRFREGVKTIAQSGSGPIFDSEMLEKALLVNLAGRILHMLSRTMVLELNVARLEGVLEGDTAAERYNNFIQRLGRQEISSSIMQEYPVLIRQVDQTIEESVDANLEFMKHLSSDWPEICSKFGPSEDVGPLAEVHFGVGDTHRGSRSVASVHFGSGFKLIYKPRSLAVDVHFQLLLNWLNERAGFPLFRAIKILDQGTHGWVEFVEAGSCVNEDEVIRFYERQGAYLALLYLLDATDFHFENMIAAGEYPVLVDLESLFHQHVEELLKLDLDHSENVAAYCVAGSVLRIGLLPQQIWASDNFKGLDISGLGASQDQLLSPREVIRFQNVGSDEMHVVRERIKIPGRSNRPKINGSDVDVLDYIEPITRGFSKVYRLLIQYRQELLASEGPLGQFKHDRVRFIARPTKTYELLLAESYHPDLLRNTLDRELHFDRLWVGIDQHPYLEKAIPFERKDLWLGDIPIFFTYPDSSDLWTSSDQCIPNFFQESSLSHLSNRLNEFSEQDLERQLWFILASFATLALERNKRAQTSVPIGVGRQPSLPSPSKDQYLEGAKRIGDRLTALAIHGKEDVCWIGLATIGNSLQAIPLGIDLYSGSLGISLFLAYLGKCLGDGHYLRLAEAALRTTRRQIVDQLGKFKQVGAFTGWGGIIYSLIHLSGLLNDAGLLTEAEKIADRLPGLIELDTQLDIISGAAGCLVSLLNLYQKSPSPKLLGTMKQCGDLLIARAQPMADGVGWPSTMPTYGPLTGFSHGAAGIAWALLALGALTKDARYTSAALNGIAYERSLFSHQENNWPDLRKLDASEPAGRAFSTAWCHGAPGIGLARLLSLKMCNDAQIHSEIEAALGTTIAQGFGQNHCLCHGDLGNLDVLLVASEIIDRPALRATASSMAGSILKDVSERGWICGVPLGVETPGLLTGLSGIGYAYLRLAAPERIPSVLALAPGPY